MQPDLARRYNFVLMLAGMQLMKKGRRSSHHIELGSIFFVVS
jgi:hypothetical protein